MDAGMDEDGWMYEWMAGWRMDDDEWWLMDDNGLIDDGFDGWMGEI